MDSIIAVRVRLDSGADRYFLTWGDLGANRCWPGDIERAVLRASVGFALRGAPVDARVCDALQAASGERYFYECLVATQHKMPAAARKKFTAWSSFPTAATVSFVVTCCFASRTCAGRRYAGAASQSIR